MHLLLLLYLHMLGHWLRLHNSLLLRCLHLHLHLILLLLLLRLRLLLHLLLSHVLGQNEVNKLVDFLWLLLYFQVSLTQLLLIHHLEDV